MNATLNYKRLWYRAFRYSKTAHEHYFGTVNTYFQNCGRVIIICLKRNFFEHPKSNVMNDNISPHVHEQIQKQLWKLDVINFWWQQIYYSQVQQIFKTLEAEFRYGISLSTPSKLLHIFTPNKNQLCS